jgi:hydrogenase expression/formation protein HypD
MELNKFIASYRDKASTDEVIKLIKKLAGGKRYRLMHVCGTHEDTISRFGIRDVLPNNIEIVAGPGCPVCVVPIEEINAAIRLSTLKNVLLTTFGDMYRVPGGKDSLRDAEAIGTAHVKVVYSITDAIKLAEAHKDLNVVHFAIGFETTAPSTAVVLLEEPPENFSILCAHRFIPPAIEFLLKLGESKIDGFILPGHVSTIIGERPYDYISKDFRVPQVIAGFEPLDVILSILMLLKQINDGEARVENEYVRTVKPEGNVKAKRLMDEVFGVKDANWRGIGLIPKSGYSLRSDFKSFDALSRFGIQIESEKEAMLSVNPACRCGEVLRGIVDPEDCPLFDKTCIPTHPIGACMVSLEGTCAIAYKYKRISKLT